MGRDNWGLPLGTVEGVKSPSRAVYRCRCGSRCFYARMTDQLECVNCGKVRQMPGRNGDYGAEGLLGIALKLVLGFVLGFAVAVLGHIILSGG